MAVIVVSGSLNGFDDELCSDIRGYVGGIEEIGIDPDCIAVISREREDRDNVVISISDLAENLTTDLCEETFGGIEEIARFYVGNEREVNVRPMNPFRVRLAA